jgi:hypothetical protein
MMMQAVLMICAIGATDCTPNTAIQVVNGPAVDSLSLCSFQSDVLRAQNAGSSEVMVVTACLPVTQVSMRTDVLTPLAPAGALGRQASN